MRDPDDAACIEGVVQPHCDFRKKAAQDWWLTQMVFGPDKRWLTTPHYDGIFSDSGTIMGWGASNITVGTRQELFNVSVEACLLLCVAMCCYVLVRVRITTIS